MLKPWKDGFWENLSKVAGWYALVLVLAGILGVQLNPVKTNPYVWGFYLNELGAKVLRAVK